MEARTPPYIEIIDYPWVPSSQCNSCKHFEGWGICKAFPDGIPPDIVVDKVIHDEEIEGQEGEWIYERK